MFYSKLLPLLKPLLEDKGLNPKEVKISEIEKIRKEWPLSDLVTATKQLIAGKLERTTIIISCYIEPFLRNVQNSCLEKLNINCVIL